MEEKLIEKLLGNRIYLKISVKLPKNVLLTEKGMQEVYAQIRDEDHLEIYAVGTGVTDEDIVPGKFVRIDDAGMMRSAIVKLSDDVYVLQVSYFDISHIW